MSKKNNHIEHVSPFAEKSAEELLAIANEQQERIAALEADKVQSDAEKAELQNEVNLLRQEASASAGIIEELSKENRALSETKGNPHPTVTLPDGRVAQLNHGALIKQVRYTVQELATRPDLVLEIVEKGGSAATIIQA